ncbi:MAG: ribosomal L7Ae/L30e/S12e/Gadd45 family protein [Eubacteriales bacterium]|nr:ribosomal L7Ae/L30e/S12e/Gadd45 family protein [Eubacteriales bacterium]
MTNDPVLQLLGLARRAGKLAFGDELVREACVDKKARCVLIAADAGVSTAKKAAFYAQSANVPAVTLPHSKDALGAAIGKNGCAVCAVTDIGLAAAALQKLAAADAAYAPLAAQIAEKNTRIQSRRGKKKPRRSEPRPQTEQAARPARPERPERSAPRPRNARPTRKDQPAPRAQTAPGGRSAGRGRSTQPRRSQPRTERPTSGRGRVRGQ